MVHELGAAPIRWSSPNSRHHPAPASWAFKCSESEFETNNKVFSWRAGLATPQVALRPTQSSEKLRRLRPCYKGPLEQTINKREAATQTINNHYITRDAQLQCPSEPRALGTRKRGHHLLQNSLPSPSKPKTETGAKTLTKTKTETETETKKPNQNRNRNRNQNQNQQRRVPVPNFSKL